MTAPDAAQYAETVRVERAALRTLLDWYDEPEQDTWGLDAVHAAQRLRLQLEQSDGSRDD